jgi:hypothetical protein
MRPEARLVQGLKGPKSNASEAQATTAEAPSTTADGTITGSYQSMNTDPRGDQPQQIRIVGLNFVAGLVISNDRVIHAAPILGYTIGWTTERIVALAQRRGWTIEHEPAPPSTT